MIDTNQIFQGESDYSYYPSEVQYCWKVAYQHQYLSLNTPSFEELIKY